MSRVLPILFNTDMVRAILDGRKTVTRRLINPQPTGSWQDNIELMSRAPYQQGDILYVRETWKKAHNGYYYYEDWQKDDIVDVTKWKPSIHMPKEAARIWLKVKDVRVERLQEITVEDVQHEGISALTDGIFERFKNLWNSTIKKADIDLYGWDANPWVWVIEFERCEKPNESPYAWNDAINKIVGGAICD